MKNSNVSRKGKGGRPSKKDPANYRYSVNFSAVEHARFLDLFEQSGLQSKAAFIKARVFDDSFRVIKTDQGTLEYVAKLTQFHAQFRAIGTNYNQVVKELHTHFSEKKALALLYKLEKATVELAVIGRQIVDLSEDFRKKW
ncbi:conjugal transfer protein MobA [Bacteroides sp. 224]|uniref:conjugal transfer protein MobA n=1 Tax=Bacteroides sp. 224 TaxID=2302936 RepID=UPI0013D0B405|nr:conjugal transfer protein MobA [Bacteroides sp. 224]NDV64671.1 MobA protein [Bacteroides sp. 224]